MDQATALRDLQAALHLRIDAAYASLPAAVRRVVAARAEGDALTPIAAVLLAIDIDRLLTSVDDRLAPLLAQGVAAAAILAEQAQPEPERAWQLAAAGIGAALLLRIRTALSDGNRRRMGQVRRVLSTATLQPWTPPATASRTLVDVTIHLEQYVNPWYATRRAPDGTLKRATRTGARVSWPAEPGMAAASARSTMLTETSAAHGEAAIVVAQRTPGALVRWRTSPWHRDPDVCTANARRDTGYGPGVYNPHHVPPYPEHRMCRCILTVIQPQSAAAAA